MLPRQPAGALAAPASRPASSRQPGSVTPAARAASSPACAAVAICRSTVPVVSFSIFLFSSSDPCQGARQNGQPSTRTSRPSSTSAASPSSSMMRSTPAATVDASPYSARRYARPHVSQSCAQIEALSVESTVPGCLCDLERRESRSVARGASISASARPRHAARISAPILNPKGLKSRDLHPFEQPQHRASSYQGDPISSTSSAATGRRGGTIGPTTAETARGASDRTSV